MLRVVLISFDSSEQVFILQNGSVLFHFMPNFADGKGMLNAGSSYFFHRPLLDPSSRVLKAFWVAYSIFGFTNEVWPTRLGEI